MILDPREYGEGSHVVYTAGETLSYQEIADVVEGHFGGGFVRELWDKEKLRKDMEENGDDALVKYRDTFAQGRGVSWEKEQTVNHQRAIPMTDVKAYLQGLGDSGDVGSAA